MQGIERPLRQITILADHEVRTNLLFTMSNRTGGEPQLAANSFSNDFFLTNPTLSSNLATALHDDPGGSRVGGAGRDRTDDILLAKQALSQLSYGP